MVIISGEMSIPKKNTNPNLFNYQNYLKSKGVYYVFSINNIEKTEDNKNILYSLKNKVIELVESNLASKYLYTFILGDMRYLDKDVKSSYQNLGISHLFSVSGMHISILSGIFLKILKKLRFNELYQYLICIIFIIFYMFLVSFCPSVLRSGIFFIFLVINKIFYFNIKTFNLLLLTISFILFINPFIIYNAGFLFSSIITASLILFGDLINKYDNSFYRLIMTSLISFLFSFPLSIYNYYQINILTIIYNLIFVPIISSIIFPLSLICFLCPFLSIILNFLMNIVEFLAIKLSLLNTNVIFSKPSLFLVFLYYFLIFLVFYYRKKFILSIFLIILFIHYNYNILFPNNYLLMIDIGQGDSILLHSGKYNILVDTGGSYSNELATNTLIPLFKSLGIRKIDYLFLSHGDYDHVGEAIDLINNFKVSYVFFNEGKFVSNEKDIINILNDKKIDYSISLEKDSYVIGYFYLYSIGTDLGDENSSSMVLYGENNGFSFLLTGDASVESEKIFLDKYNLGKVDILKVGHHGSKTSTSTNLVNEIKPHYALISAGLNNKFNHPNKEVLENLKDVIIYRTDLDGGVLFLFKKNELEIKTWK